MEARGTSCARVIGALPRVTFILKIITMLVGIRNSVQLLVISYWYVNEMSNYTEWRRGLVKRVI